MNNTRPRYHYLKISLAAAGMIAIIIVGLHLLFVYNARTVLKQFITEQSAGKIKLELSQLDLNLLSKHLQVHQATLLSTDSLSQPITYKVTFSKLSLHVGSVWQLLAHKQLLLDSLKLYNPSIQVVQWRKDTARTDANDELSIPQEMGKVYNSLLEALNAFGVRRIVIDNARFSLLSKVNPASVPVHVSNIYFNLARTPVKEGKKNVYRNNEHSIELRSTNQDIVLPGGRHRLSFKAFNLHLFRQSIELDSCTVTAVATDSVKSSYSIFFKKLLLNGVDFNALSTKNLIKADTVFCEEPLFNFNLYRTDAIGKRPDIPDPSNILRELAGNLNLAFVGVKNAGLQMDINGKTKRSFYNSGKDNFEIHGFRLNPDSASPVTVQRFDMILRDYLLYNEDSTSVYSFDSLHFINNKIVLNNFRIKSRPGAKKLRNLVDIQVPFFSLTQLDWYRAIFEQTLVAREAVLHNPVINFTRKKQNNSGRKINLFDALLNIDSMVALEKVAVHNGRVNMQLGAATSFHVQHLDFNVYSNRLLQSTNKEGLRSAVEQLSFSNGVLQIKDITARLSNARFTGNNLIYADKVDVAGKGRKINATIEDVFIDNLLLDDDAEAVEVDGLGWQRANVVLQAFAAGKSGRNKGILNLRNVAGNNTAIRITNGSTVITTFVKSLEAASLVKSGNHPLQVEGFNITGHDLYVNSKGATVNAAGYNLSGSAASTLAGVQVSKIEGRDSIQISTPHITFAANLNDIIADKLVFADVQATAPVIKINKWDTASAEPKTTVPAAIQINNLKATEPEISIATYNNDSVSILNMPPSANSAVQATGIVISGSNTRIGTLSIHTTSATLVKPTGEKLGVEKGKIDMDLSNIQFGKTGGKLSWSGFVNQLQLENANGLQLGKTKNNLFFQNASLGNLTLSSALLPDFSLLLKQNVSAWLRIPQGQFVDSNTTFKWYNASFNNNNGTLNLDSFVYHPTQPLDSVLAKAPYQLDYITAKTGRVSIAGLDVAQYERDSAFIAQSITINDPVLTVYRDKQPPLSPFRKDKLLPVEMLKSINLPVAVGDMHLENGLIIYAEKNKKSGEEGTIYLNNVHGTIGTIKNNQLGAGDSLALNIGMRLMDAADIQLQLKQSYTDTLNGFVVDAKIGGADLRFLNPILVPLANVKVASGILDTVAFRFVGRKDVALGEMAMHYRNLRIRLVKDGNADETTFLRDVASFIANTFVIRSNNAGRTGLIYYKRFSKQSFVNYIIKSTLSGMASSVGAKSKRNYLKQYHKTIKENNYPAIRPVSLSQAAKAN